MDIKCVIVHKHANKYTGSRFQKNLFVILYICLAYMLSARAISIYLSHTLDFDQYLYFNFILTLYLVIYFRLANIFNSYKITSHLLWLYYYVEVNWMENVQKMSGWFSHQRHETSETQPKRQEKNEILVKWRNLCVC